MTTILTQGDTTGQPCSALAKLREVIKEDLDAALSMGPVATSLDTWVHLDIEPHLSLAEQALNALADITNSEFMKRAQEAFALSGDPSLVAQGRRMAECSTKMQLNCSATHASMCPNHCDVRACANCNIHRSRRVLRRWGLIEKDVDRREERLRFVTLTMRAVKGRTHGEARSILKKAWAKLWRRKVTRHYMKGALRKLETTWNEDDGWWHVHLHLVYEGKFWPRAELRETWRDCIGGVEVGGVEDGGAFIEEAYDAKELMKYSLKHHKVPADKLVEWAQDMHGVRELEFLGTWRKFPDEEVQEEATDEQVEAFRLACDDEDATGTEARILSEPRLKWIAWAEEEFHPEFVRIWARERLREAIRDVARFRLASKKRRLASEKRRYSP